jgi:D-alanyl-lipoteichoic acid acyltransferase DltB (MBOAT superfamily)
MTDTIETPENMLRCMSNNYSAMAFWRAWHRSFNRWIIRYIYIPLGGSKRPIINTLAVFTFVAIWHDISLKLLAWGWLVTLFILPEVAARMIMPPKKVPPQRSTVWLFAFLRFCCWCIVSFAFMLLGICVAGCERFE